MSSADRLLNKLLFVLSFNLPNKRSPKQIQLPHIYPNDVYSSSHIKTGIIKCKFELYSLCAFRIIVTLCVFKLRLETILTFIVWVNWRSFWLFYSSHNLWMFWFWIYNDRIFISHLWKRINKFWKIQCSRMIRMQIVSWQPMNMSNTNKWLNRRHLHDGDHSTKALKN